MPQNHKRIRPLNTMEQAFTISNARLPLCVVCVLQVSDLPETAVLQEALGELQSRHPLLRSGIVAERNRFSNGSIRYRRLP